MRKNEFNRIAAYLAVLAISAGWVQAADPHTIRAVIQSVQDRKPAPDFVLENAAVKTWRLSDYGGKVLLLDFWATECGGCVREMPGFMDLAQAYRKQGLSTVGISVDILYENLKNAAEA